MKAQTFRTLPFLAILMIAACTPAYAQTTITEDFTNPSMWTMIGSSSPQTTLTVANGRINYVTTSTGDEGCGAQWNGQKLPVNKDWSISADVHIDAFTLTSVGQFADILFGVGRTGDLMNTSILFEYDRGWWGSGKGYDIDNDIQVNGIDYPGIFDVYGLTSPDASLRLDYVASTRSITFYFDANGASGGYSWASQGVLPMGDVMDLLGITNADTFTILVVGSSEFKSVSSGVVYLKNMKVTTNGSTPPTKPSITSQPQSTSVNAGSTAQLGVTATGSTPLYYQWYIGSKGATSNPINGAIENTYTTPALTTTTSYWVRVTNAAGSVDSETATVAVENIDDIFYNSLKTTWLGNGWYWNELLGFFYRTGSFLYVYGASEWVYLLGYSEDDYYIYRFSATEWGWCSLSYYPWYYSFGLSRFRMWDEYRAVLLGSSAAGNTYAASINEAGVVVGSSGERAFIYKDGVMTDLGTLGGDKSAATCINNQDQVVGWSETTSGDMHAFLFEGGLMKDLGTLGGQKSQATAINDSGWVVGWADTDAPGISRAFLYKDGAMTNLGAYQDGPASWATDINNHGDIIGTTMSVQGAAMAAVFKDGQVLRFATNFSWPTWGTVHTAQLNEQGHSVGLRDHVNHTLHAYVCQGLDVDGVELPTLGGSNSNAIGINNSDMIVGNSQVTGNAEDHAFLIKSGRIYDLSPYLVKAGCGGNSGANGINDAGWIIGHCTDNQGPTRAFILMPQ